MENVTESNDIVKLPLKAMGYMLGESLLEFGSVVSKAFCFGVDIPKAAKEAYKDIKDDINAPDLPDYDTKSSLRKSINIIHTILKKIAGQKQIILVIDELDRCLPPYQIKILERIHHLMEGQPSINIYAINPEQLRETIEQMYGGDSEVRTNAYLKKFIDFQVPLPIGSMQVNIYERYKENFKDFQEMPDNESKDVNKIITMMFSQCDVRTINKIWEKQRVIHTMVYGGNSDLGMPSYKIICVELMILVMIYWRKYVYGSSVVIGLHNTTTISPDMLVYSAGLTSQAGELKSIKEVQELWNLWSKIASSLSSGSITYNKDGELTIISLPTRDLSILECIGIYWCNASNNKFLQYKMGNETSRGNVANYFAERFKEDNYVIGEFYKLACIIL